MLYGTNRYGVDNRRERYGIRFSPLHLDPIIWCNSQHGITMAGANLVSDWADIRANGLSLAQAGALDKPTWTPNQLNGAPALVFDGIRQFMTGALGADYAQPNTIILVCSEPTDNGNFRVLCDGDDAGKRHIIGQDGAANLYYLHADNSVNSTQGIGSGFKIFAAVFNGAASILRVNGTDVSGVGNVGIDALDGLTIGAINSGGVPANTSITDGLVVSGALSTLYLRKLENFFRRWYNLY